MKGARRDEDERWLKGQTTARWKIECVENVTLDHISYLLASVRWNVEGREGRWERQKETGGSGKIAEVMVDTNDKNSRMQGRNTHLHQIFILNFYAYRDRLKAVDAHSYLAQVRLGSSFASEKLLKLYLTIIYSFIYFLFLQNTTTVASHIHMAETPIKQESVSV